jgi:hypothetical protein
MLELGDRERRVAPLGQGPGVLDPLLDGGLVVATGQHARAKQQRGAERKPPKPPEADHSAPAGQSLRHCDLGRRSAPPVHGLRRRAMTIAIKARPVANRSRPAGSGIGTENAAVMSTGSPGPVSVPGSGL